MNALPKPSFPSLDSPKKHHASLPDPRSRWKKILLWIGVICGSLIVLLIVGIFVLLHSAKLHAYLLRTAQTKASEALGSEVRFRDFAFQWAGLGPSVELYNIVVDGAPPYTDPPLVQADMLRVQITINSLWHRSWYVNDIEVKHPIVRILADRRGQTNLPQSNQKSSSKKNNVDIFQLGIRHLSLEQGEVYYNDQKSDLTADVHELGFQLGFGLLEKKYSGTLSYRDGHVQWGKNNPIEHNFDARFSLTPAKFVLEDARLRSGHSQLTVQATADNYSQPKVHAIYHASIDTAEFRRVLKNNSLPVGIVALAGVLDYQNTPDRPFLATTSLQGEAHSPAITISQGTRTLHVGNFAANYSLNSGDARISGIRGQVLGGELAGDLRVKDVAGSSDATLAALVKNVSAQALQDFASPESRAHARLNGKISTSVNATWRKALDDLSTTAQVEIAASMQPAQGHSQVPIDGSLHARYDGTRQTLEFLPQSAIHTPQTSLSLSGMIGNRSALQVRLQSGELAELDELAIAFRGGSAPSLGLHGQGSVAATINGSTQNAQVRGQLNASNVRARNTLWKSLHLQFAVNSSSIALDQGELIPASRGRITFGFNARLQQWAFSPTSEFHTRLQANDLDAHELAQLAGVSTQVKGVLAVDVEAHGSQNAPVGKGTIDLAKANIADEPIKSVKASFQADGKNVSAQAHVDLDAGSTVVEVRYTPNTKSYDAMVHTAGIKLEQLENVKSRNLQLAGTLTIDASGQGTLDDPGGQATIQIPQLTIRDQAASNIKLVANVGSHVAKFNLDSDVVKTHASAQGTVQLTGDYPADISLNTQTIALQPIFAIYAPEHAADLSGQTEIHATLRGPLKHKDQIEAHLEIPQLALNYKDSIKLAVAAPIHADYVRGTLDVKRSEIRGTDTDLIFQANIPSAKQSPVAILLQGSINLQLVQLFSSDITSSGQIRFDINSMGARSDPSIQGQIKIVDANITQTGMPLGLHNGNGVLTLTRDRLNITEFKGQVGGGTVTANGGVNYRPDLQFDLAMKAEGVRALYAQSVRATVNSNLAFSGKYDNAFLRGQVSVEQLSFTSSFDLMTFASQFGGDETTPPAIGGISDNVHLDIAVETPGGLNMSSRNLSVAGSADLHVRGTASQPVLLGRVNVSEGDLIFYGNRYLVQGGTIDFRNPSRTVPVLDMAVNTTIQQYDIQMHFWGPADHLRTNYSSDPSLPPADIINLIAFGKTSEAAAANPSPSGSLGAQSLIASQVSGQVTSRIEKLAGISQLSVDPELGSSQQSPGARIAIQQRVTGKIFVTFATDVTATQQQIIQVEYQVSRKTSFKAVRDQNGGFSLQTSFRKEW